MLNKAKAEAINCDIFIATAAVADYRAAEVADNKLKKSSDELTLTFVKNPDILATIAALEDGPFTVGFAAESQNVEAYAKDKLIRKKLDMIAANDITREGLGFNSDDNALHVYWQTGDAELPTGKKSELAKSLLSLVATHYKNKKSG